MELVGTEVAAAALAAGGLAHWALARLGRRLPVWRARRRSAGDPPFAATRLRAALAALRLAVWAGALAVAVGAFPGLRRAAAAGAAAAGRAWEAPLLTLGSRAYSTLDLLALPLLFAALWLAASGASRLLRARVLGVTGADPGAQEAVTSLARLLILVLGSVVILQSRGIDLSSLAIVGGVIGVGLGFGLQNLASNFVSGVVISLERPIKPGDFVQVGELRGTVERIGARSTEIRTLDRVSILVPNARFLEQEVVNWSHGDPVCRVHVPVGVAYGSDLAAVREALLEAPRGHPLVLADPPPEVNLERFGESSLDLELEVWTDSPRDMEDLVSDLNFRVARALERRGLEIPFPQRDLHLRAPALERALGAWARRRFGDDELRAAEPAPAPVARSGDVSLDVLVPRTWSEAELDAVLQALRGPGGVPVADRRHRLVLHPRCFVGREAVDWLVRQLGLPRCEARRVGQLLMERGALRHVLDEHGFRDGFYFYRFRADEPGARADGAAAA